MLFLWIFLPCVIVVNFILGKLPFIHGKARTNVKNAFLLFASLLFYAWGGIYYLLIMIASITINYISGRLMGRFEYNRKLILVLSIIANLAILFYFKYFNMVIAIIENVIAGTGLKGILGLQRTGVLNFKDVVLPIGISFFTFQSMSYVFDVYMEKTEVQKNIVAFALYVSLFPQLIAGPIVKYSDVAAQLENRSTTVKMFHSGVKRFCYGLGKKVLIANTLGAVADSIWALDPSGIGASLAWLGALSYTLQIYYDFSGYSDMAIGIGRMLGFSFNENFNYPYTALTVVDFWRRWHISLTSWFREYVYFPLGGSRKGETRTCVNILIVYLLTGIWHGANFTFIIWGIYFAVIQIFERTYYKKYPTKIPFINWPLTMFLVMIGWILFRSTSIENALVFISQLFKKGSGEFTVSTFLSGSALMALVAGIVFSGFIQRLFQHFFKGLLESKTVMVIDGFIQIALLSLSIISLVAGTYNPFIYFQF